MTKITPGINRVMVIPDDYKQTFGDSLLIIPDNKKKINNYGKVLGVGKLEEPYSLYPDPIKEGDRVIWSPNWASMPGHELTVDGKQCFLFHIEMVLGKLI